MSLRTMRPMVGLVGVLLTLSLLGCGGGEGGELEILDIQPRVGATAGEQPVRIIGNNFRQDIGYTVYFGGLRSTRSTLLDEHTLLVATPTVDEAGNVDVRIAADNGPAYRIAEGFRYEEMGNVSSHGGGTSGQGEERF